MNIKGEIIGRVDLAGAEHLDYEDIEIHTADGTSEDDLIATAILTLNAGHEATVHAIGNSILALARQPAVFEELRNEPGLVKPAVEELLRYDTPLQMFERWVYADLEWQGHGLVKGTKVALLFGAANHDPEVFADPERIDLGRDTRGHLSFGVGVHHCVGSPLARMELQVALSVLAQRLSSIGPAPTRLPRIRSLVFRGVQRLPLEIG